MPPDVPSLSQEEIQARVEGLIAEATQRTPAGLTGETKIAEIEGLDSFAVITLFMSIEGILAVQFTTDEIQSMNTLGEIVTGVSAKLRRSQTSDTQ